MAVLVEISRGKTVPPASQRRQAHGRGHVAESLAVVVVELERHPFPRRHQIQSPVTVKVDPDRRGDHSSRVHELRGCLFRDVREAAPVIA